MTTPRQPTPATPEHVANYVAAGPDFTCPRCRSAFILTGDTPAKQAAALDAWTCECTPPPDLAEWRSPAGVGFAAVMLAAVVGWLVVVVWLVGRAL